MRNERQCSAPLRLSFAAKTNRVSDQSVVHSCARSHANALLCATLEQYTYIHVLLNTITTAVGGLLTTLTCRWSVVGGGDVVF